MESTDVEHEKYRYILHLYNRTKDVIIQHTAPANDNTQTSRLDQLCLANKQTKFANWHFSLPYESKLALLPTICME